MDDELPEVPVTEELDGLYTPPPPAITFDDVLVSPAYSEIESRETIDTGTDFLGLHLNIPIISANMDYITGPVMLKAMYEAGGMGILHRFAPWEEQLSWMTDLDKDNIPFFFSVGIRDLDESKDRIAQAESLPNCIGVCIDVAHGHHKKVGELVSATKKEYQEFKIIAGNIATPEGANYLIDNGTDAIKVGIGAGSVCTTRLVAGVGIPQLTAIIEVSYNQSKPTPIIADGGIRNSADLFKALVAGATVVMVGSVVAGTTECPSPVVIGTDNRKYRPFRGQSIFGTNGDRYVKEGIEGYVEDKGPVKEVLRNIQAGLRSGMSYIGATNISEIREKGRFVPVSYHTQAENHTRIGQVI
jgi:IMP dehydrogenase